MLVMLLIDRHVTKIYSYKSGSVQPLDNRTTDWRMMAGVDILGVSDHLSGFIIAEGKLSAGCRQLCCFFLMLQKESKGDPQLMFIDKMSAQQMRTI